MSAVGGDLVSMTSQLVNSVGGAGGIDTIGKFAGDMMDFGSFIASGVHTSAYTSKTLVGNLNSVDYMAEYFIVQLGGKSDTKTTTTPRTTAPATTTSGSSGR